METKALDLAALLAQEHNCMHDYGKLSPRGDHLMPDYSDEEANELARVYGKLSPSEYKDSLENTSISLSFSDSAKTKGINLFQDSNGLIYIEKDNNTYIVKPSDLGYANDGVRLTTRTLNELKGSKKLNDVIRDLIQGKDTEIRENLGETIYQSPRLGKFF